MFIIPPWQASLATPMRNIRVKGHSGNTTCRGILYGYMSHNWPWNIPDFEGPPVTGVWLPAVKPLAAGSRAEACGCRSGVQHTCKSAAIGRSGERKQAQRGTKSLARIFRCSEFHQLFSLSLMSVEGASLFKSGQRAHEFNQLVFLHFPSVPNARLAHETCKFW